MTFRSNTKAAFAFSALAIGVATLSTEAAAASQIQGIQVSQPAANVTQLRIAFDGKPVTPTAYQQAGGNQLTLDFQGSKLGKIARNTAINRGVVNDVTALSNGTTARLVVGLKNAASYSASVQGNQLVLDIVDAGATSPMARTTTPAPQTMNVQVNPLLVPNGGQSARKNYDGVSSVRYLANRVGGGDISIALTNESIPVDVQRQGNRIIVRTAGSTVPKHLLRRLNAGGLVANIDANNQGQNGVITINMSGDYEYQAYQTGSSINISVRPPKMLREPTIEEKVYKGEPLSMEFENVPVRTVLDVLARFTNLNIVASDAVQGEMTLRVINVPWDQVLDIILKSKNLDKRVNGNVIIVGPADALAEQERKQLEEQKKIKDLIPLRTEYIRLNYAKAEDVMRLISEARNSGRTNMDNGSNSLLSERGAVSIDARTNTLIVKDTTESINNIHELVRKIDVSVKQVMIEARIVNASDTFSKDLGVRWGLAMNRGDWQAGGSTTTLWDIRETAGSRNLGRLANSTITTAESGTNMAVDLGVANPAGRIALGLLSLSDTLLDLELSAMQADKRGEIISSPKVLTADKQRARISSGRQIPFLEASASGAATTAFKEAALSLEVTPNITPDGKIGLTLDVRNAQPDTSINGSIQEDSIQTSVLLDDGQTVVLGGVYRQQTGTGVTKVPFLGDLPYVGRLFKTQEQRNDKTELLIFITPKLINDGVSRIN